MVWNWSVHLKKVDFSSGFKSNKLGCSIASSQKSLKNKCFLGIGCRKETNNDIMAKITKNK